MTPFPLFPYYKPIIYQCSIAVNNLLLTACLFYAILLGQVKKA